MDSMAAQKRKAGSWRERWTYRPRPTGDQLVAVSGGPREQSHMHRIEFAASHPVFLESDRRWIQSEALIEQPPSKSGQRARHFPLRMPYATPFLLTNARCARGQAPARPPSVHGLSSSASEHPTPCTPPRHLGRPPPPVPIGRSHSRVAPQPSRAPTHSSTLDRFGHPLSPITCVCPSTAFIPSLSARCLLLSQPQPATVRSPASPARRLARAHPASAPISILLPAQIFLAPAIQPGQSASLLLPTPRAPRHPARVSSPELLRHKAIARLLHILATFAASRPSLFPN